MWQNAFFPYVKSKGAYRCPSDVFQWSTPDDWWNLTPQDWWQQEQFRQADGQPFWVANSNYISYGFNEGITGVRLARINRVAETALLADCSIPLADFWNWPAPDAIATRVAFASDGELMWYGGQGYTANWFRTNFPASRLEAATRH